MITILVTGANGLLGQKLISQLDRDPDVHLVATAREKLTVPLQRGSFQRLDVADSNMVDEVIGNARPQVVIHTAAMTQVDQCETDRDACWLQNVHAVEYLVKACAKHSVHLIHLSTDFVFDGSHGPLDETAIPKPLSHYGRSKLAAEEVIQQSTLSWAILRTVLVYGVTEDQRRSNIVLWVKKSLEEGKPIRVVTDQWRTPTWAEDLADGCVLAAKKKAQGIFHVSGEEMMTPYDIAIRTAKFFKLDLSLITKTDSNQFKQAAPRPLKTGFVIENARRVLGFAPHTFEEGLAAIASQLRTQS